MQTVDSLTAIATFPRDDSQLIRAPGPWSFLNLTPLSVLPRDNGTSSSSIRETAGCIACTTTTALASLQDCAKLSARRYLHPILAWSSVSIRSPSSADIKVVRRVRRNAILGHRFVVEPSASITTTHLGWDARHWPIPFVNVHRATVAAALAPRSFPEAEHQPVVVILETRPESQLAGFITAPERRNTVVNDVFVHATRFNHP